MEAASVMPVVSLAGSSGVPRSQVVVVGDSSSPGVGQNGTPVAPGAGQVMLKDVVQLVRLNLVAVPSGFTKLGYPILYFPATNSHDFHAVLESDLHLLFKYYLSVVPRTEQGTGFALIVDRRTHDLESVRSVLQRVVTLFPARIREAFLLHHDKEMVSHLMDDLMLDFDVYQLDNPTELLHYVDRKCLPVTLGGQVTGDLDNWLVLQDHVEGFSYSARRIARRLAQFVGLLNQEDVNYRAADSLRDIATKNRSNYRRLRKELEDLTDHGLFMLKSLQRPDANMMQRLAVQVLCKQLDQAWTYFSRSWKMQDHVYVQYLELNTFQQRFRELSNEFATKERLVRELPVGGTSSDEVNAVLDKVDTCAQTLAADGAKARELSKLGQDLLSDGHNFAADCVQPKVGEMKMMCQKLELLLEEKRRLLHKFLELLESVEAVNKWCLAAGQHLDRDLDINLERNHEESAFSQIRQIDYLLSKSRELKLRSRPDFEEGFDQIKDLIAPQTLFAVDDALDQLEAITVRLMQRREELRSKAMRSERQLSFHNENAPNGTVAPNAASSSPDLHANDAMKQLRRENILSELLSTEAKYVSDLEEVLVHYRDKLLVSNLTETRQRAQAIFGNLDDLHDFHAAALFPELERCGANPAAVARAFVLNCHELKLLYTNYCQNMHAARQAIQELGGEQAAGSILYHCQQEAGHQLPLSSYLLKPMQRLTKYQLLLKDLTESSNVVCGKPELEEALAELLAVIKVVNDNMHDVTIKNLPTAVQPLGGLNAHDAFQVNSENKGQSQILFRNRNQRRHVFLYDNQVVFCKPLNEKSSNSSSGSNGIQLSSTGATATYQFKFSLGTASLGMSSIVKGEDKKIELWVHGRNELYVLEAKTKKAKEAFAAELRKVIIRQKEQRHSRAQQQHHAQQQHQGVAFYDTTSSTTTTASSESDNMLLHHNPHRGRRGQHASRLTRSRSLEGSRANAPLRSRSVDCAGDRSSPDELLPSDQVEVDGSGSGGRFIVLADYMALTSREIDLSEDEIVELVKVGCAGWWYVRLTTYPYPEGWAPSTYLEKVPQRE